MVREHSVLRCVHSMGVGATLQHPTDGGYGSFYGLSKVQVNLKGPVLFQ